MKYGEIHELFRIKSKNYEFVYPILERYQTENAFWNLPRLLAHVPEIPLTSGRQHKWGILTLVLKGKDTCKFDKIKGEWPVDLTWETLRVRPLLSYARHYYRRWFSLACRAINKMSDVVYKDGDACAKTSLFLQKVGKWNGETERLGPEYNVQNPTSLKIADIEAFYNNVDQGRVGKVLKNGANVFAANRRKFL